MVTGARPTRNSAYLVFDTLYGIDTEWNAQPQVVAGHTVEEDGGRETEPGLLGTDRVADQGGRPVLLWHQLVAEPDHVAILHCALLP